MKLDEEKVFLPERNIKRLVRSIKQSEEHSRVLYLLHKGMSSADEGVLEYLAMKYLMFMSISINQFIENIDLNFSFP